MKRIKILIIVVFLAVLTGFFAQDTFAAPGINKQLNFQGKVVNSNGTNIADGNYNAVFSVYNVLSAGSSIWSETWNTGTTQVAVTSGIFNVNLGTYNALTSIDFNNDSIYLGVNFQADGEMTPRVRLTAVPYAINAEKVNGLTVTNTSGTLTVPNSRTISFADAFQTLGAYSMTISATAATGITLPTTGTLATLAGLETFSNKNLVGSTISGTTGLTFSGSTTDIDTAAGEALVIQGRAASTIQTTSGTIFLQPSGASIAGFVQIGAGVATSTPDLLVLDVGNSEAGGTNGAMYYNSSLGKFRCYTAGAWGDCGGSTLSGGNGMLAVGNTLDLGGAVTKNTRFNIGSTEVMFFNYPNGTVGIGTTTVTGAKVQIAGNLKLSVAPGSATPSFMILDSASAEPGTGVEGAMYYNTGSSQFRCYRSGAWGNCATTTLSGIAIGAGVADNWSNNNTGIWINTTGTGDLIKSQANNEDKFVVGNAGNVTVTTSTSNLVKTTTGTTKSIDFSLVGSTMVNVGSTGDSVSLIDGTIPAAGQGTLSLSSVAVNGNVAGGGQAIIRDDGKYVFIRGGGTTAASLWDGVSNTMTSMVGATGATPPGLGAIALKRPDKRYLLVHGGGSAGLTSIFDPMGMNGTVAGPAVCGGAAISLGTNAFLRADGRYVIMCGGQTAWGVYNPTTNAYAAGTAVGQAFGAGAHALQRDDGMFIVFRGAGTTAHWLYNPNASATGTMTLNPITGASVPTISAGSFSIKRNDGKYLVLPGAINTSNIYDPSSGNYGTFTPQSGVGYGPTVALGESAQSVWRQDGKYMLFIGSSSTATNIINQSVTTNQQFLAGPSLSAAPGAGLVAVMRPNGQYQVILGNNNTTTNIYDMGYVIGGVGTSQNLAYYETECMTSTALNASSSLSWNVANEGQYSFQVKTGNGSCSGAYKPISRSGEIIGAAASDNRVQVKVNMQRNLPTFLDQEWGVRKGAQTRYRRINFDPAIYDFTIDNSSAIHKTQFDFGNSNDASGPVTSNLVNDKDNTLALSLAMGVPYGSTINATNASIYNGAFARHYGLPIAAGAGTVVMRRPDGMYVIVGGTSVANATYYNAVNQTYVAGSGTSIPTDPTGLGALAVKRPDGKFLMVMGRGTTKTNIFDPTTNTFTAGPGLIAAAGRGSLSIPLPTGRIMIIHGNFTTGTSIYDPIRNIMANGPVSATAIGGGSISIPKPDGSYLIIPGVATEACTALTTTTNIFNPYTMQFVANPNVTITTGVGPGAFAFQRSDGQWVIVHGGGTAGTCAGTTRTQIYNPITNKALVGPVLSAAAQKGAFAMPRYDGTWLITLGSGTTATSIYLEKAGAYTAEGLGQIGQFVAGPTTMNNVGEGGMAFQKDDGKYIAIMGTGTTASGVGTTATNEYDALWAASGFYRSEQFNIPNLTTSSVLTWKASPTMSGISAEVRTASSQAGLQTATSREITYSGGLINPAAGDVWMQVNYNFKRAFPSYGGIQSDVWSNGGNSNNVPWRNISTPVLSEYKVTQGNDLVNLKADGISMFRVASNGSVYTSSGGVINTGGADLAENYTSDTVLEKGEVVSIDPANNHGIKRSNYQYQPDLLGVVSSDPGFVAGSYTKDSYPVALVGRVPVKVSTENGPIKVGDRLTSSSIPGYAMRATKSGRVLGEALEALNESSLTECPEGNVYVADKKCGTVMMFVNLADYSGEKLAVIMEEKGFDPQSARINSGLGMASSDQEQILSFLMSERDATDSATLASEVYTDNVYATNQIISPQIVTDLLYAKRIKADSIEGMEILTDKISSLSAEVKNREANPISFFKSLVEFWNNVVFRGSVNFENAPTFNQNMAGFAVINKDSDKIDIRFDKEFEVAPIVNISLENDGPLGDGYVYMISSRSNTGFTITLNKAAQSDIKFSWMALAIKDPKTYQMPTPTPTPLPTPTLTPEMEITPIITPTPIIISVPTITTSPESSVSGQNL